jgi:hypothetical protein
VWPQAATYLAHVVGEGKVLERVLVLKVDELLGARDHLAVLVKQKMSARGDKQARLEVSTSQVANTRRKWMTVGVPFKHAVPYSRETNGAAAIAHGVAGLRPMLAGLSLEE